MDLNQQFRSAVLQTRVLLSPQRKIATFGDTRIKYFFISEIEKYKDRSRLHQGIVIAERPKIITIESLQERFEGFDPDARKFGEWLTRQYGDSFRALEYRFRNEAQTSDVEHTPARELSDQILGRLTEEERKESFIARGPGKTWQISLMKFIVDECGSSFRTNVQDLEQHGYFDTSEQVLEKRKKMVNDLFRKCRADRSYLPVLGAKLREFGLFAEYQDDFFNLIG